MQKSIRFSISNKKVVEVCRGKIKKFCKYSYHKYVCHKKTAAILLLFYLDIILIFSHTV